MNVEDYQIEIPTGDKLRIIFNHQRELMNKYHAIEEQVVGHSCPSAPSDFGPHCGPLDIHSRSAQLRFKDFAWRITEELTEATLALNEPTMIHYHEELIDALHFSVELLIMSGMKEEDFGLNSVGMDLFDSLFYDAQACFFRSQKEAAFEAIESLGEAMNRLKLKPWKQTAVLTDLAEYHKSLKRFFHRLVRLLHFSGFNAKTATQMYLNKNAVNQFRIRTNY